MYENNSVRLMVSGDFYPGGDKNQDLWLKTYKSNFETLVPILRTSDINIVNLEGPFTNFITPIVKEGPCLRSKPEYMPAIKSLGFNVASLANNHIMDMGEQGLYETLRVCKQTGMLSVGAGNNLSEASLPLIVDVKGIKIAIISITENEFSIADFKHPGACPQNPSLNYRQISDAKSKADFVLVIYHGGNEYFPLPSPRLVDTCHFFVDVGANAVVCHHSHISSGWESYKNSFISYGVGNFFFPVTGRKSSEWFQGYLVELTLERSQHKTNCRWNLIPYLQNMGSPWKLMEPREKILFLDKISNLSKIIIDPEKLFSEWEIFCNSNFINYMSHLLGLKKIERGALRIGIWPFWRFSQKLLPNLLNLIRCESHRDVLLYLLNIKFRRNKK